MRVFLDDTQDARYATSPLWGDAGVEDELSIPLARVEAVPIRGSPRPFKPEALDLSGTWLMKGEEPAQDGPRANGPDPSKICRPIADGWYRRGASREGWRPVTVPTSVQNALIESGELADPFWNTNTYDELARHGEPKEWPWHYRKTRIERAAWWFARDFNLPTRWKGRPLRLSFEGVDASGSIYFNDNSLGHHFGLYGGLDFDVTAASLYGRSNTVAVRIAPVPSTWHSSYKVTPGFGWHFGHLISLGIWRPVTVGPIPEVELRSPFVKTLALKSEEATLAIEYTVRSGSSRECVVRGFVRRRGGKSKSATIAFRNRIGLSRGLNRFETVIRVKDPAPWWPLGLGGQDLYELVLEAAGSPGGAPLDSKSAVFGIRTISMRALRSQKDSRQYRWQFTVNGTPIFVMGANWGQQDPLLQIDSRRYERMLELARRAGIRMFRNLGSGIVETEEFYRRCDEKGILVYQELPLCGHGVRDAPRADLGIIDRQTALIVKALRNHPSLVMWGGGNENGMPKEADEPHTLVGKRCRQLDPTRAFHRTDGWGGSIHNYSVFHMGEPMDTGYRSRPAVFYGEYGAASMTNLSSALRYLPREALKRWPPKDSDHGVIAHMPQFSLRDIVKVLRYANYGPVRDWKTYSELSQMAQADGIRFAGEMQREGSYARTGGFWFFKFNELFPGQSWGIVDYYGSPKVSYYSVKRFFARRTAFATYEKFDWKPGELFSADLHAANDTAERLTGCTLSAEVYGSDLAAAWTRTFPIASLDAFSVRKVAGVKVALPPAKLRPFLLAVSLRDEQGALLSDQWYWFNFHIRTREVRALEPLAGSRFPERRCAKAFAAYAALPNTGLLSLPEASLEVHVSRTPDGGILRFRNTSGIPVVNVIIEGFPDGDEDFLDDNGFCLHPWEEREVGFELGRGANIEGLAVRAWNVTRRRVRWRST